MAAVTGSIIVTPVATTNLKVKLSLTATPGAIVLTGLPVGLLTLGARVMIASPGAINLNGTAAGGIAARPMLATAGAVNLTGNATGLLRSVTMPAISGAITLTGYPAGLILTSGYKLIADPGAIVLTGNDADLIVYATTPPQDIVMSALPGSIMVIGSPADLDWSGEPIPPITEVEPGVLNMGRRAYIPNRW
jgi:hypothetical protein